MDDFQNKEDTGTKVVVTLKKKLIKNTN